MWVQACPCLAVGTHPVKSNRLLQVIFSENFGTEGRGGYFDQVGVQRREQWQAPPNCLAACQCDATCPLLQCSAFACLTLLTTPAPLPCRTAVRHRARRDPEPPAANPGALRHGAAGECPLGRRLVCLALSACRPLHPCHLTLCALCFPSAACRLRWMLRTSATRRSRCSSPCSRWVGDSEGHEWRCCPLHTPA